MNYFLAATLQKVVNRMNSKLMTTHDVAKYLGYTTQHVARLAREGKIRAHKISIHANAPYTFDLADVQRYNLNRGK